MALLMYRAPSSSIALPWFNPIPFNQSYALDGSILPSSNILQGRLRRERYCREEHRICIERPPIQCGCTALIPINPWNRINGPSSYRSQPEIHTCRSILVIVVLTRRASLRYRAPSGPITLYCIDSDQAINRRASYRVHHMIHTVMLIVEIVVFSRRASLSSGNGTLACCSQA